jgi:energy-coupling factor transporter ATP-binding protein EcfA2
MNFSREGESMPEIKNPIVSPLESEILSFISTLPYWAKYLAAKALSTSTAGKADLDKAYHFFLQDAGLSAATERPEMKFSVSGSDTAYKQDLRLIALKDVQGVNAIVEKQDIQFHPNLTVIYGINGSGKSGYVRLLKKAFYSRTEEDIVRNIHESGKQKQPKGTFVFQSGDSVYDVELPQTKHTLEHAQFAVYDFKSVNVSLNSRNQYSFKPHGLMLFGDLTELYKELQKRLQADIDLRTAEKDYTAIFKGESPIAKLISEMKTTEGIKGLKAHLPFTEADREERRKLEEKRAALSIQNKEREIKDLDEVLRLLEDLSTHIQENNKLFSDAALVEIRRRISDLIRKEELAKKQGLSQFETDRFAGVGSNEWNAFIKAANAFAIKQIQGAYPRKGDKCLLCLRPLDEASIRLIKAYWKYLKGKAKEDARAALEALQKSAELVQECSVDLLPEKSILTKWVRENHPKVHLVLLKELEKQKKLRDKVLAGIKSRKLASCSAVQVTNAQAKKLILDAKSTIAKLKELAPSKEIEKIDVRLCYLSHKEKLSDHIEAIEDYLKNRSWAEAARKVKGQLSTRVVTDTEKEISQRYFGQSYAELFETECRGLDAEFGIEIRHIGSSGSSFRELRMKDYAPSAILSEGEQTVISLADFLSEIALSGINRGIIFDDPVTSLDEERKSGIAQRLVIEAAKRQVVIFTHDLVFVSSIVGHCESRRIGFDCHWIEKCNSKPGYVFLKNAPNFEKAYKSAGKAINYYEQAKNSAPEEREQHIAAGFSALRTSYEALVVFDLFCGVVQRFNERVSIDSLSRVRLDDSLRDEIVDSFSQCCRYMEGHSHSDKYSAKKPRTEDLKEEIDRYTEIKKKIKKAKGEKPESE